MRSDLVPELLLSLCPEALRRTSEAGIRDGAGFLLLRKAGHSNRWAVVTTPGDRWFSVEVDGNFSMEHFEEETADEDVERILTDFMSVAAAYLETLPAPAARGFLRSPVVRVETPSGPRVLRRSLVGHFRHEFRRRVEK